MITLQQGLEIKPKDPEEFALKKEYVRKLIISTNLKAEEEKPATLDFVRFSGFFCVKCNQTF